MFGCGYNNWIKIKGGAGGKTYEQGFIDGTVTMSGLDDSGKAFRHKVIYKNGMIADRKYEEQGRTLLHIVYGSYEKDNSTGEIVRFKKGTKTSKHGKARSFEKLFGKEGVCHSWYSSGRLIRQKFIYDNGVTAYCYSCSNKPFAVKDYNGFPLYEITGALLGGINSMYNGSHSILNGEMQSWFSQMMIVLLAVMLTAQADMRADQIKEAV